MIVLLFSTTFRVLIDVVNTVDIDEPDMKECHIRCKDIVQIYPRNSIMINNAISLEEEDVTHQRSDLVINREFDVNNMHQISNHSNCTNEILLHTCKLKMDLQQKFRKYEIQFVDNETKDHLAQKLANKFFQDLLNNNVADDL